MSTTPDTPAAPQPPDPTPRRFERSSRDRIIGGVCGGLGRYFGIDPILVRIGFVALAMLGGTGLVVYAAALVLVPNDGEVPDSPTSTRDRYLVAGLAVVLVIVGFSVGLFGGFGVGGALVPLAFLALAGLAVYWLASGRRPTDGTGSAGDVLRRAALGVLLLIGCGVLAIGSFLASGLGGGVAVAALVIVAGAGLVGAAFVGGARWLVLPALAVALPLAFVSAANIDLGGGFGERTERPATVAELHPSYRLGAGELVVDLRDIRLPAGDSHLKVGVGAGHAVVLVPRSVCVASSATVGVGAVQVLDRDGGGIDFDWSDGRRAPARTPRLVLDGDVGVGFLEVRHERGFQSPQEGNDACVTTTAAVRGSGASNG